MATAPLNGHTWTTIVRKCQSCKRDFRVSRESIDMQRANADFGIPNPTDEQVADSFEFCLSCCGSDVPGERDGLPKVPDLHLTPRTLFAIHAALLDAYDNNGTPEEKYPGVDDALALIEPVRAQLIAEGFQMLPVTSAQAQAYIDGCWPDCGAE